MLLTRGLTSDFDSVCALYARVTSAMHEKGIAQWNWGTYPNADQIRKSIDAGTLYVVREGNTVVAAVTLDSTFEPAYDAVNWLFRRQARHVPPPVHRAGKAAAGTGARHDG